MLRVDVVVVVYCPISGTPGGLTGDEGNSLGELISDNSECIISVARH